MKITAELANRQPLPSLPAFLGGPTEAERVDGQVTAGDRQGKSGPPAAQLDLSTRARTLASAVAVANRAPDVRELLVAEIRGRFARGEYRVDAEAIAARLLDPAAA